MMFFRFTHDYRDDGILLAQIDMRAEIFGDHGEWFVGEIEAEDLDAREWRPLVPGSRLKSRTFRRLREDPDMRRRIEQEFAAHCRAHGGDGLLDAEERKYRHARESVG